jgi:hypothetical protein
VNAGLTAERSKNKKAVIYETTNGGFMKAFYKINLSGSRPTDRRATKFKNWGQKEEFGAVIYDKVKKLLTAQFGAARVTDRTKDGYGILEVL